MVDIKGYIRTADEKGSVNISHSVVSTIAAAAAIDVDGICGLFQSPGKELTAINGKKSISKGAKVTVEDGLVTIDVFVLVEVGYSINEVAAAVQNAIISAVDEAVGVKADTVNVNVCGVSLKKQ